MQENNKSENMLYILKLKAFFSELDMNFEIKILKSKIECSLTSTTSKGLSDDFKNNHRRISTYTKNSSFFEQFYYLQVPGDDAPKLESETSTFAKKILKVFFSFFKT